MVLSVRIMSKANRLLKFGRIIYHILFKTLPAVDIIVCISTKLTYAGPLLDLDSAQKLTCSTCCRVTSPMYLKVLLATSPLERRWMERTKNADYTQSPQ